MINIFISLKKNKKKINYLFSLLYLNYNNYYDEIFNRLF